MPSKVLASVREVKKQGLLQQVSRGGWSREGGQGGCPLMERVWCARVMERSPGSECGRANARHREQGQTASTAVSAMRGFDFNQHN